MHHRLHVFTEPRTFTLTIGDSRIAIGGFPFVRDGVRERFSQLVAATGLMTQSSDARFLCIHQLVEGARVGPSGHAFRDGEDVVRASDLPRGVTAVLCGHVHRYQVLRGDLSGKPLPAPVVYAGSTERTSFAEVDEAKGFVSLVTGRSSGPARDQLSIVFRALPARPMYCRTLGSSPLSTALARFRSSLAHVDPVGILRIRIPADLVPDSARVIAAVKAMVASTMILSFRLPLESKRFSGSNRC